MTAAPHVDSPMLQTARLGATDVWNDSVPDLPSV